MARVDGTQADILEATVEMLIRGIPEPQLNESTCFVSLDAEPPDQISGDVFITVSPDAGRFPEEFGDGGGAEQCTEEGSVTVTAFIRCHLDNVPHGGGLMLEYIKGLSHLKRAILRALTATDPVKPKSAGDVFVRNLMQPLRSSKVTYDRVAGVAYQSVSLRADFDWDLAGSD